MSEVKKRATLKTQVYEYLKEKIILGDLKPGERLIEEKIAEELNISRSPIREAIQMLEKDRILNVNRSGGVTVVQPTIEDYQYLYECRVVMEPLAAFYAAERCTPEKLEAIRESLLRMRDISAFKDTKDIREAKIDFHESLAEASLNPFLISMISQFRVINSFYRKAILHEKPQHFTEALTEHQNIFQAIADQEPELARKLMKEHIENDYILFVKSNAIR